MSRRPEELSTLGLEPDCWIIFTSTINVAVSHNMSKYVQFPQSGSYPLEHAPEVGGGSDLDT